MARTFVTGSSQYLKNATAALTTTAVTLAAWYKPGTNFGSVNNSIVALSYSGGTSYFQLRCNGTNALAVEFDGTTVGTAVSGGTLSVGTWAHMAAVFTSHSSRTVYLNGTGTTDVTGTPAPASIDTTSVGAFYTGGALAQYADGDIADVAIWDVALTSGELTLLAAGASPGTIQPSHLKFFAPLGGVYSPEPDQTSGARNLTITGATASPNSFPPLLAPVQQYGWPPPPLMLPPARPRSFTSSIDLPLFFPPTPPSISTYGRPWPKPVFPKSSHATLGGFLKPTDPWTVPDFSSALLFINVGGIPRAYGRDTADGSIDDGSLSITDTLNETPNTCQFVARGFTPTVGMRVIIALAGITNPSRLFAGTIKTVSPRYVGTPDNQTFDCGCIDDTWLLNKRKVIKTYTSTSASAIAQDLLQTYAPGFTWRHVDPSLETIDLITFTNETLTTCLTRLAKRIGVDWKIDYFDDLWFGTTGDGVTPVDLTDVHDSLDAFNSTTDLTDIITRCLVEGGGVNALSMVAVGDTILPVQATDAWYNAAGGTVVVGTQRLTYTGIQAGGSGSLVGPGIGPAAAPTLALAAGAGIESGAHGYAATFVTAAGESLPSPTASITTGAIPIPTVAPTLGVPSAGTGPDTGDHGYAVSFVNATGETTVGQISHVTTTELATPASAPVFSERGFGTGGVTFHTGTNYLEYAVTFVNAAGQTTVGPRMQYSAVFGSDLVEYVTTSSIPIGPSGTTSRKLYRTLSSLVGYGGTLYLVTAIGDNTTTTYKDEVNDASLGAAAPSSNTAVSHVVALTAIPLGDPSVTARNIYRTIAGGSTYKLAHQIADNVTTTWSDTVTDASLGATAPSSNTATANRVSVSAIQVYSGTGTVTQRKLYRTVAGGSQLKLLTTIADNVTTTYADSSADASLGANVPTSDTSGLTQPAGVANAGATSLLSAGVSWASSTGGWAVITPGTQVIRYTGLSGNTLTGIPATGAGAIMATIAYNSTITAAPCLTGIPASSTGSILYLINKGDPVNLLVQVDDTDAQAILSALLDPDDLLSGGAGIREDYIQDQRISETEARARGLAQLELFSRAQLSVTYTCRDPLTASGRSITIDLPAPTSVSDTLTIQQVTITNFGHNATLFPTYAVEASTVRMSFEDLVHLFRARLDAA